MSRASILMRRMPAAGSSLLRRGRPRQGGLLFHPSVAASAGRGPIIGASSSSSSSWRWRSTTTTTRRREVDATRSVSSAARDDKDEDDDDVGTRQRRPLLWARYRARTDERGRKKAKIRLIQFGECLRILRAAGAGGGKFQAFSEGLSRYSSWAGRI